MKVGNLVKTMQNRSPWEMVLGIVEDEDPRSLHGSGWWVLLCTGDRVSRIAGDLELVNKN